MSRRRLQGRPPLSILLAPSPLLHLVVPANPLAFLAPTLLLLLLFHSTPPLPVLLFLPGKIFSCSYSPLSAPPHSGSYLPLFFSGQLVGSQDSNSLVELRSHVLFLQVDILYPLDTLIWCPPFCQVLPQFPHLKRHTLHSSLLGVRFSWSPYTLLQTLVWSFGHLIPPCLYLF